MINISDKSMCCGCSACQSVCPKNCISLKSDKEGFCYPNIDFDKCIDCHLCEKTCPVINKEPENIPLNTYAALNENPKIRENSSSGGIFYLLAEKIIEKGGLVFGAKYNEKWDVIIDYTDKIDGVYQFMGSKYVQANPLDSYKKVRLFLEEEKIVLFSGTPCQIAGLRRFLHREYDNLFLVDIICHGVPSPLFWQKYIKEVKSKNGNQEITKINFRDKIIGWKNFSMMFHFNNSTSCYTPFPQDRYMFLFLKNYILRPSCYNCAAKSGKSRSDITIGDFWGIQKIKPEIDDDLGISAVLTNTTKGEYLLSNLKAKLYQVQYKDILAGNPMLQKSVVKPAKRQMIFRKKHKSIKYLMDYASENTISFKLRRKLRSILRRI